MFTSKYAILVYINLPLIISGIIGAITTYKTRRVTRRHALWRVAFWIAIGVVLSLVGPAYDWLVQHKLTDSPPLSIFDIILLTLILFSFVMLKRSNERVAHLNKRLSRLHENLVIAEEQRHWDR